MASEQVLIKGPFCAGILYSYLPRVPGPLFPVVGEERRKDGFLLGANILEQSLKLCRAFESPGDLVKTQVLIP